MYSSMVSGIQFLLYTSGTLATTAIIYSSMTSQTQVLLYTWVYEYANKYYCTPTM